MTTDDFHARAIRNLRLRHEIQIAENTKRVRDHIGYILKRIEAGRAETTGMYAQDIAASVQRILISIAALETLGETTAILATSEEPETP